MIEYIEPPSTERLPGWNKAFISVVDEKIDMPLEFGTPQIRDWEVLDSSLGIPAADLVRFGRLLTRSYQDQLTLVHYAQPMYDGQQTATVSHKYGSREGIDQLGSVLVEAGETPIFTVSATNILRTFVNQLQRQDMRRLGERPTGTMVALVH